MAAGRGRSARAAGALLFIFLYSCVLGKPSPKLRPRPPAGLRGLPGPARRAQGNNGAARSTWNNCACNKSWTLEGVGSCDNYCCNPDQDSNGPWCMVKDALCEDSSWGYCRPANASVGACTDSPPSWADREGDTCGNYGREHWCTATGGYGEGWDKEWGKFEDYAGGGDRSATTACCNCGGGTNITDRCADLDGWHDSDGDTCSTYQDRAWCNHTGGYGVGWHREWGLLQNFSRDGKTAFNACCACGGGTVRAGPSPSPSPPVPASPSPPSSPVPAPPSGDSVTLVPRATYSGCACKKDWSDAAVGEPCSTYCCNPDSDDNGDWCFVEDQDCEEVDWGYCKPLGSSAACTDTPAGWADSHGHTCSDYKTKQLCTSRGQPGAGWKSSWGTFSQSSSGGKTAAQVCCECGGGSGSGSSPSYYDHCSDVPNWKDADGDDCQAYGESAWCTTAGKPGVGWHEEWGSLASHAGGSPPPDKACCACGGSSDAEAAVATPAPAPASGATPVARYTWNGCECKQQWSDEVTESGGRCASGCCNLDHDTFGDWCMVKDPECEESDWGYCRSVEEEEDFGTCKNEPLGWEDREEDGCATYSSESWCTSTGGYGTKWDKEWGKFEDFRGSGNKTAAEACCLCGGGSDKAAPSERNGCTDKSGWADPDGDTCAAYEGFAWCTSSGGFGVGWHEEWGEFGGSPPAQEACCFCGGGTRQAGGASPDLTATAPGSASSAAAGAGGAAGVVLTVIAVITGLGLGWYCYRTKQTDKQADAEGLGAGPGKATYGRKYQTVEEPEL